MSNTDVHFKSEKMDWETPQDFFDKYNQKYLFDLDVCATDENAKCKHYFTVKDDGLSKDWIGKCWMNPPYGREIGKWVKKAYEQTLNGNANVVVCLVPARTDTAWWHDYAMKATKIEYIRGRLKFQGAKNSAPFPSAVLIFASRAWTHGV